MFRIVSALPWPRFYSARTKYRRLGSVGKAALDNNKLISSFVEHIKNSQLIPSENQRCPRFWVTEVVLKP